MYRRNRQAVVEEARHLDVKYQKAAKAALGDSGEVLPETAAPDVVSLALSPREECENIVYGGLVPEKS